MTKQTILGPQGSKEVAQAVHPQITAQGGNFSKKKLRTKRAEAKGARSYLE